MADYSRMSTRALEPELIKRGLLPPECKLIEVSIAPHSALVIRYEVYVRSDQLALFAEAMNAVAVEAMKADEERQQRRRDEVVT
jgi:hypothetical protein